MKSFLKVKLGIVPYLVQGRLEIVSFKPWVEVLDVHSTCVYLDR